ncbi:hypothetical protein [Opitutus sp. GAS368]|uniref:hypothetical protein n=1 Tax=Opitutus sp. GAS368 TaxID=1882749 RepID=UPI00087B12F9|nr:hypothetical protein [Opitutus sp. GAS368]SDS25384.1 hypothetical protein SAMN05444173_2335 [Opitutus sp. GAS368]
MTLPSTRFSPARLAFLGTFLVALLFAVYTRHAWEDYYITFRSSKNLATGHGLVFNVGDKLHTFTSPLGVLLPAVSYLLTFNSSDEGALWIFRLMSAAALGGAAGLLMLTARRLNYGLPAGFFLVACLALDAKTVDFTINGMETGFMVLFLAYVLWAHLSPGPRQWRHLGAAWAGLMWTRPDSFVYIGLVAAGFWLFNDARQSGTTRTKLLGLFLKAGLLTTALYLPWLLFAQLYYGTAVPHTITAKSGIGDPRTLAGLLQTALQLPFNAWADTASLKGTFLPAYYMIGGWPDLPAQLAGAVALVCALLWLVPFLRVETRVASFAFFWAHAYLSYCPYFPFPWYLPAPALLAIFTLGSLLAQALQAAAQWQVAEPGTDRPRRLAAFALTVAALLAVGTGWITWQAARQLAAQQQYVENGNRRKIGEWLHANAKPGDTVFMEPLGYIGYFSGLKTYDFPGMSSREMVKARKEVGNDWAALIDHLQPKWLVLRPNEINRLNSIAPNLLASYYTPAQEFSVADEIGSLDVLGRRYLEHDARFTVFRLVRLSRFKTELVDITSRFEVSHQVLDGVGVTMVHAPGQMVVKVPPKATTVKVAYGFPAAAYAGEPGDRTDGATFQIEWEGDSRKVLLLDMTLDPAANPAHRGLQHFEGALPATEDTKARLIFRTLPGATMTKDWTCWSLPEFP